MYLRINKFLPHTRVEGPGDRACIWVQGCPIHCTGCAVPWTWTSDSGEVVATDWLAERILNGPAIEGVTFVGGEPFAQAKALAQLGMRLQAADLSIVTFTGYVYENLCANNRQDWQDLLAVTDLLIDGPYRQDLADTNLPWIGSSNQRYHFLSPRYRHLENTLHNIPNRLEIRVYSNGQIFVNGMATSTEIASLLSGYEV
jgi:anaerobic ribonucleoside-triphosphate reductase activating protein